MHNRARVPVIGILGPAGSGKDLVADFFTKRNFAKIAFSDPMKRFCQYVFDLGNDCLWGPSGARNQMMEMDEQDWFAAMELLDSEGAEFITDLVELEQAVPALTGLWSWFRSLYDKYHDAVSARIILQTIGTEWGRAVDKDMWSRFLYKHVYPAIVSGCPYSQTGGLREDTFGPHDGIIIPDHRFANEVMFTRNHGGYVIRLHRPGRPQDVTDPGIKGHASETEQETLAPDFFHRDLHLPEGVEHVERILEDLFQEAPWG